MRRVPMSRTHLKPLPIDGGMDDSAGRPMPDDSAKIAEEIGFAALKLAKRAQAAGLLTIGYLLESVALEAGAEAAQLHGPDIA
jgi:hypothetical protein